MRPISLITLGLVTLFGVGAAFWIDAGEKPRRHWPKPTEPPPPSPIYTPLRGHVPDEEEIEQQAREHNGRLEAEIENALASRDRQRREAVFVFLLPELVQTEAPRAAEMVSRQRPGEARNTLRTEVTRVWVAQDLPAAVRWIKTLPEDERHASAATAVESLLPQDPAGATALAGELGVPEAVSNRLKAARD